MFYSNMSESGNEGCYIILLLLLRKLTQIEVQHTIGVARGARSLPKLFGGDIDEFHRVSNEH